MSHETKTHRVGYIAGGQKQYLPGLCSKEEAEAQVNAANSAQSAPRIDGSLPKAPNWFCEEAAREDKEQQP